MRGGNDGMATITLKEAFEAVRVLWPDVEAIKQLGLSGHWIAGVRRGSVDEVTFNTGVTIDWGDLTQYPPPDPKWRPATVEDAIRALRGETVKCRFGDSAHDLMHGTLTGYSGSGFEYPWCTFSKRVGRSFWRFCEVQE